MSGFDDRKYLRTTKIVSKNGIDYVVATGPKGGLYWIDERGNCQPLRTVSMVRSMRERGTANPVA